MVDSRTAESWESQAALLAAVADPIRLQLLNLLVGRTALCLRPPARPADSGQPAQLPPEGAARGRTDRRHPPRTLDRLLPHRGRPRAPPRRTARPCIGGAPAGRRPMSSTIDPEHATPVRQSLGRPRCSRPPIWWALYLVNEPFWDWLIGWRGRARPRLPAGQRGPLLLLRHRQDRPAAGRDHLHRHRAALLHERRTHPCPARRQAGRASATSLPPASAW